MVGFVDEFLLQGRSVSSDRVQRKLSAILSADAVEYSRLMAHDDVATVREWNEIRAEVTFLELVQADQGGTASIHMSGRLDQEY